MIVARSTRPAASRPLATMMVDAVSFVDSSVEER
jgi:hypothetical protein